MCYPTFQVENLEELLKEKDNQVDIARTKLSAVQAQTFSSEGTVTSLEEALPSLPVWGSVATQVRLEESETRLLNI